MLCVAYIHIYVSACQHRHTHPRTLAEYDVYITRDKQIHL